MTKGWKAFTKDERNVIEEALLHWDDEAIEDDDFYESEEEKDELRTIRDNLLGSLEE